MDEPTASLSETEIQKLFGIVKDLRKNNVTVIYISHRLDEIFELADEVTVMRDGRHIETKPITAVKDRAELIKMMIGKTIYETYIPPEEKPKENNLKVENVRSKKLKNISFNVKKGEIVGFYGLIGAGKTEIARAIYGVDPFHGTITFEGKPFHPTPHKAIKAGVALVPEERRTQGLFTMLTIRSNVPVMSMNKIATMGFLNTAKRRLPQRNTLMR